jgi:glyoxylase I family protein
MRLHHASLIVSDTERSLAFYRDLLGLEVEPNRPDLGYPGAWLNLQSDSSNQPKAQIHLLELPNPDPVEGRPKHGGRDRHIALEVENFDDLREKLDRAGIPFTLSRSGRKALFCRDPDQNTLEFIADS